MELFKWEKNKTLDSVVFPKVKKPKKRVRAGGFAVAEFFLCFRVRECHFSLKYRAIRPSAVFGTRRKAALHGEAYAWVPDL